MSNFPVGDTKVERFLPKNQCTQRKLLKLRIGVMRRCQKLDIVLENKVIQKLILSKNVNYKKCALIFFNGKENWERFWSFHNIQNWLWKSSFVAFDTSSLHQFSKFNNFLWVCWFLGKNLSNFVPPAWKLDNSYYHTSHCCHLFSGW